MVLSVQHLFLLVATGRLLPANAWNNQQTTCLSLRNRPTSSRCYAKSFTVQDMFWTNNDRAGLYRTAMGIHTVTDQKSNITCSVLGNIYLLHSLSTWAQLNLCSTYAAFWQLITTYYIVDVMQSLPIILFYYSHKPHLLFSIMLPGFHIYAYMKVVTIRILALVAF